MPLGRPGFLLLALPLLLAIPPGRAHAIGVFEDAAAGAGFFSAPHRAAVGARLTVTDAEPTEASLYVVSAVFPVKSWFLFGIDLPYVTATTDVREIEGGFGDLRFRGRMALARSEGRLLALIWGLGAGSGTSRLFPYSSQALEFAAAVAWLDTLDALQYWVSAGGELVERAPDELVAAGSLADFARFGGGVGVPFGHVGLRVGLSALYFRGGTLRDHYFAEVTWDRRDIFRFHATAQMEGARRLDRVLNSSVSIGMTVFF